MSIPTERRCDDRLDVAVADGRIADVAPELDPALAREVLDASGKFVFPGIIDSHNHPYYADNIEQFSLSAAYGGTMVPEWTLDGNWGRDFVAPLRPRSGEPVVKKHRSSAFVGTEAPPRRAPDLEEAVASP